MANGDSEKLFAIRRSPLASYSIITSGSPNSTGWPSSTRICVTVPARVRGNLVHRLHRFDDQQRLSDRHLAADFDERLGAGLGGPDRRCRPSARAPHPGCLAISATTAGGSGAPARRGAGGLEIRRHRGGDADVARHPHPQAGALDLDFGEAGLVQQQRELANERAVVAGGFAAVLSSGWRAMILIRNFLCDEDGCRQAFALTPILAARPVIASR